MIRQVHISQVITYFHIDIMFYVQYIFVTVNCGCLIQSVVTKQKKNKKVIIYRKVAIRKYLNKSMCPPKISRRSSKKRTSHFHIKNNSLVLFHNSSVQKTLCLQIISKRNIQCDNKHHLQCRYFAHTLIFFKVQNCVNVFWNDYFFRVQSLQVVILSLG